MVVSRPFLAMRELSPSALSTISGARLPYQVALLHSAPPCPSYNHTTGLTAKRFIRYYNECGYIRYDVSESDCRGRI